MCQSKAEGGARCFTHTYADYRKNTERIRQRERIINDGQRLTETEYARLRELDGMPSALTAAERREVSVLRRIQADGQALTKQEEAAHAQNLKTRAELEAHMDTSAVVRGPMKRKELEVLRADTLTRYAKDNDGLTPTDKENLVAFLNRRAQDADAPLTHAEAALADRVINSDPLRYAHNINGRSSIRDADKLRTKVDELREEVSRYEELAPHLAPKEERDAYDYIQKLREDDGSFALTTLDLSPEDIATLPPEHQEFYLSPNKGYILALAQAQDRRVFLYSIHAERARYSYVRKAQNSPDREVMEAAIKAAPFGPTDTRDGSAGASRADYITSREYLATKSWNRPAAPRPAPVLTLSSATRRASAGGNEIFSSRVVDAPPRAEVPWGETEAGKRQAARMSAPVKKATPTLPPLPSTRVPSQRPTRPDTGRRTELSSSVPAPAVVRSVPPLPKPPAPIRAKSRPAPVMAQQARDKARKPVFARLLNIPFLGGLSHSGAGIEPGEVKPLILGERNFINDPI